jgi:hypothetical protein
MPFTNSACFSRSAEFCVNCSREPTLSAVLGYTARTLVEVDNTGEASFALEKLSGPNQLAAGRKRSHVQVLLHEQGAFTWRRSTSSLELRMRMLSAVDGSTPGDGVVAAYTTYLDDTDSGISPLGAMPMKRTPLMAHFWKPRNQSRLPTWRCLISTRLYILRVIRMPIPTHKVSPHPVPHIQRVMFANGGRQRSPLGKALRPAASSDSSISSPCMVLESKVGRS